MNEFYKMKLGICLSIAQQHKMVNSQSKFKSEELKIDVDSLQRKSTSKQRLIIPKLCVNILLQVETENIFPTRVVYYNTQQ